MWGEIEPRNKSVTVSTPHEESQDELEIEQNSRESSDTNNLVRNDITIFKIHL